MSAKPTPGPWFMTSADEWTTTEAEPRHVQFGRFDISAGSANYEDEDYYCIGSVSNANNSDANEANARLIVAAPDLLAALQALVATLEGEQDTVDGSDGAPRPNAAMAYLTQHGAAARAAIAAATGADA